jgi:hypothetical protein
MSLRVVLYAEGAGELRSEHSPGRLPAAPGELLLEEEFGPAHVLVRRTIQKHLGLPEGAIRFEGPLRTRGRIACGSDLLHHRTLRELLTWLDATKRPHLVIVLVDQDGHPDRRQELEQRTLGMPVPRVFGVAVEEFEAWLIADVKCLQEILGYAPVGNPSPEGLKPGDAKRLLSEWSASSVVPRSSFDVRLSIASSCELPLLAQRCPAFDRFARALAAIGLSAGSTSK